MSEENSTSNIHLIEHRLEKRMVAHVPVEITEIDGEGKQKIEQTFIEDVSDFGCRFSTRGPVKQGDTIVVKMLGRNGNSLPDEQPRFYEIMWVAAKEHGATVGARVLQGERLADTKFPSKNGTPKPGPK